jgi:hypothetical protein
MTRGIDQDVARIVWVRVVRGDVRQHSGTMSRPSDVDAGGLEDAQREQAEHRYKGDVEAIGRRPGSGRLSPREHVANRRR